jgi:hypothetical protein
MPKPPPSGGGWTLVPYVTDRGRCPIRDWLEDLRVRKPPAYDQLMTLHRPRIEAHGPHLLGARYWVPLGDDLYEIRWSGRCRIYCSMESRRRIMMYMGVIKRWPKFDSTDRKTCIARRADFRSSDYDQEQREYLYHDLCQKRRENGIA